MNNIRLGVILLLFGILSGLAGCHHPEALYQEPPRSPVEQGRIYEQEREYAKAEQEYLQIDDIIVRDMTLNQLAAAWDSVNANIIRAQESVNQQPADEIRIFSSHAGMNTEKKYGYFDLSVTLMNPRRPRL